MSDDLDYSRYGVQKLDKAAKFLGKAENELQGKLFLPPIRFKIDRLRHAHIIMRSGI